MQKKLSFEAKEKMVQLAGACFWYWKGYHSFLDTCGVPRRIRDRYPQGTYNKYDLMRNVLNDLESAGKFDVINAIVSGFYSMRGPVDKDDLDVDKAMELLKEFREIVGNDPIEEAMRQEAQEKARKQHKTTIAETRSRTERLNELNGLFIDFHTSTEYTPQQRGYELERLYFRLLEYFEVECKPPYKTASGEQIDGHFKYEKFDYLVEVKWEAEVTKQKDLSIFDGKIRGKAQSTRGLFLSANGFSENAIQKYSGDRPRILLMTGEDLALVLNGQIPFNDAMQAKVDAIVRKGEIYFPLRSIRC
ncbi:MAG: restriction endonuclease [Pseudomonadota bacterium]